MRRATDLPIKKPCPREGELPGTGAVRHCAACATDVVDLSLLTAREAEQMLAHPARPRCVSYQVDEAGNVLHQPPPVPVAPRRRLPLLVGGLLLAACNGSSVEPGGPDPHREPVAQVAAESSSSTPLPSVPPPPPSGSAEPTEKHTRGELAAVPGAQGQGGAPGCDVDGATAVVTDKQGNPLQPSPVSPSKKPKKPKTSLMRGYM